jgi:hypothetical protein
LPNFLVSSAISFPKSAGAPGRIGVAGASTHARLHPRTTPRRNERPHRPRPGLDAVPDGYRAMNERHALKVMIQL